MNVGDRVSWNFNINTEVVYGHVVATDGGRVSVKWADGSGPTWTYKRYLVVL